MENKNDDLYKLKLKLKLNQRTINKYDDLYLDELEKNIYGNSSNKEKINYELNNILELAENKDFNYKDKYIYKTLLEELIKLMEKKDSKNDNLIMSLISTLQILSDESYGFYKSVKNFNNDYYNYLDKIISNSDKKYKKGKSL